VSGTTAPLLRIAQDGLDSELIAAAVVVLRARMRAGQAAPEHPVAADEQRRRGPGVRRRLDAVPRFLPPRSWQAPSSGIYY
jgi:hypothetical protein